MFDLDRPARPHNQEATAPAGQRSSTSNYKHEPRGERFVGLAVADVILLETIRARAVPREGSGVSADRASSWVSSEGLGNERSVVRGSAAVKTCRSGVEREARQRQADALLACSASRWSCQLACSDLRNAMVTVITLSRSAPRLTWPLVVRKWPRTVSERSSAACRNRSTSSVRHSSRRLSSERPRPRKRSDRFGRGHHARAREPRRVLELAIGESRGDPWRPRRGSPPLRGWRRLDRAPSLVRGDSKAASRAAD